MVLKLFSRYPICSFFKYLLIPNGIAKLFIFSENCLKISKFFCISSLKSSKFKGVEIKYPQVWNLASGEIITIEDFINKVEDNDGVDKKRSNAQVELLKLKLERDGIR